MIVRQQQRKKKKAPLNRILMVKTIRCGTAIATRHVYDTVSGRWAIQIARFFC